MAMHIIDFYRSHRHRQCTITRSWRSLLVLSNLAEDTQMQLVNFIIDLLHRINQPQISCLLTTTQCAYTLAMHFMIINISQVSQPHPFMQFKETSSIFVLVCITWFTQFCNHNFSSADIGLLNLFMLGIQCYSLKI